MYKFDQLSRQKVAVGRNERVTVAAAAVGVASVGRRRRVVEHRAGGFGLPKLRDRRSAWLAWGKVVCAFVQDSDCSVMIRNKGRACEAEAHHRFYYLAFALA